MKLHELNPLELLDFLKEFQDPHYINLKDADVEVEANDPWARITLNLNEKEISYAIPLDWTKQIGSTYYYNYCKPAWDQLAYLTFARMPDWVESIYIPWVKNDTGHNMSDSFHQELLTEIERIIEFLKVE